MAPKAQVVWNVTENVHGEVHGDINLTIHYIQPKIIAKGAYQVLGKEIRNIKNIKI